MDRRWAKEHPPPPPPLREYGASWYSPESSSSTLGCSGYGPLTDATMEVANKTLACGTRVRVCADAGGHPSHRCVNATVEDRGPYVAGRDWDLNVAVARAIGFGGVGPVWVAVR